MRPTWAGHCVLAAGLLALHPSPAPRTGAAEILFESEPADGTLWFRSSGSASSGAVQLGAFDIGPSTGAGTMEGLYWGSLVWSPDELRFVPGSSTAIMGGQSVYKAAASLLTKCLGAATLDGGFIVYQDASGANVGYQQHLGAFVWDTEALYVVEFNATSPIYAHKLLAGAFNGVAVLGSKIYDDGPAGGGVDTRIVATALAYTNDEVYLVEVDLADGTITDSSYEVLDPLGNSISNLRGITVVNSAFDVSASPNQAQGAAYLWNGAHVWWFAHRASDHIGELFDPATSAGLSGCWGVMPVYTRAYASSLPLDPDQSVLVFDAAHVWIATEASVTEHLDLAGDSFPTYVQIGSPLIKRQASGLYEILARSTSDNQRGLVVGLAQRAP